MNPEPRVLSELRKPFKADKHEFRLVQLKEVEEIKHHLASSNLNVSAEIIHKAVVFPEENERD